MRPQSLEEERWNAITHAIAALMGLLGLFLMLEKVDFNKEWAVFSISTYGASIIVLFTASTLYHYSQNDAYKHWYRIVDHSSIYLLIAGTYTPVLLLGLTNSLGWVLFGIVWGIAGFGIVLKLFFTGRFEIFSTLLYLVMGWLIVFDFTNTALFLGPKGVLWLFAGGLLYTVGIIFYAIQKLYFNHVIWHLFVVAGAFCHFIMVYYYVI